MKKRICTMILSVLLTFSMIIPTMATELTAEDVTLEDDLSVEDSIDEDVPNEDVPNEEVSDEVIPDEDVTDEEISDEVIPDEVIPDEVIPDEDVLDEEVSDEEVLDDDAPEDIISVEDLNDTEDISSEEIIESYPAPTNLKLLPASNAGYRKDSNGKKWYSGYNLTWNAVEGAIKYYVYSSETALTASQLLASISDYYPEDELTGTRSETRFKLLSDISDENYYPSGYKAGDKYYLYVVAEFNGGALSSSSPLTVTIQSIDSLLDKPDFSNFSDLQNQLLTDLTNRKKSASYTVSESIGKKYAKTDKYGSPQNILDDYIFDMGSDQLDQPGPGGDYLNQTFGQGIVPSRSVTVEKEDSRKLIFTTDSGQKETMWVYGKTYVCTLKIEENIYPTTKKQEEDLTKAIKTLCTSGELAKYKNSSDGDKAIACTNWVHSHCSNSTLGNNPSDKGYHLTAHAAYFEGKSDCRGQVLLLYRLLRQMGVASRVVYTKISDNQYGHLWNLVKIGDYWYSCDATTGACLKGSNSFSVAKAAPVSLKSSAFTKNILNNVATSDYNGKAIVKTYTIKYVLNGGKNSSKNPKEFTKNKAVKLYKPTRKYYTFGGWYSDKKLTKKITSIPKGTTKNKTIYAKWTANKYNIKFNKNGGTGTMNTLKNVSCGKSKALPKCTFTKKGYKFAGWATSAKNAKKGKVKYKDKKKIKNLTSKNGKTVTLYAVWKKKK